MAVSLPSPIGRGHQPHMGPELQAFIDQLVTLEQGRQAYLDRLWASIPSYVQEDAFSGAAGAVQIDANRATSQLYKATVVVASVPTGSTGTIFLGDATLPVPAGITVIPGSFLVGSTALRRLVITPTGVCALHVFGELLPTMGTMH